MSLVASHPTKIPPNQLRAICSGIAELFSYTQLDAIIYQCFSDHKIKAYASPLSPPFEVAYACVTNLEQEGQIVIFLAKIISDLSPSSKLYQLIVTALPETKSALPKIESQIPDVIDGLRHTRDKISAWSGATVYPLSGLKRSEAGSSVTEKPAGISDPEAKCALVEFRSVLQSIQYWITLLDCYKNLHDCLHGILLRPFVALLASVRAVADDDWQQLASLREYQDQVRSAVTVAQAVEQRLPDEGESVQKAIESKWIAELDEAANIYGQALNNRNAAAAKVAVIKISIVLKDQSPRLNTLIVASANKLPLDTLRTVLTKVVGDEPARSPEIAKAIAALSNLKNALRSRVAEHDLWQEVEKGIWYLDQLFSQSADPVEDFTAFWPEVRTASRTLANLSPSMDWSRALLEYSAQVDDELLRYDAAKAAAKDGSRPKSMLGIVFAAFRSEARMRFFKVDQLLKQDCSLLIRIGAPVDQILRDLNHD
jgi:hypothetical protein